MNSKYLIFYFTCISAIFSIIYFNVPSIPFLWLKIMLYITILGFGALGVQKILNKTIAESNKTNEKLLKDLNRFNFEAQVTSSQISSVSEQLNINLDENNAFGQQLYAEAKEMSRFNSEVNEDIHATISKMKEIIELLEDINNSTIKMNKKSQVSSEVINSSRSEIMEIVKTINEIRESTNNIVEHMANLHKTSNEVAFILETVNNISKQTHLLSLNAAIESARAGESGKGFAVIAGEIGQLALSSSQAVKSVNELINSIQSKVECMNELVSENTSRVEKGVNNSGIIENNLSRISDSYDEVMEMVEKINRLSEKEIVLVTEVSKSIETAEETINIAEQNVESVVESIHKQKNNIEEIAGLGTRLNEASYNLSQLLDNSIINDAFVQGTNAPEVITESLNIIKKELLADERILSANSDVHRDLLKAFIEKHDFVEAAWSNDKKGRFICSIPESGIANAVVREWFKRSISGEEYISPIYISAITKNPCLTISMPIKSLAGEIIGVVGVDLKLS